MMELFGGRFEHLPVTDADIMMFRNTPLGRDYGTLLQTLVEETPWRTENIKIWGKSVPQPRLIAWYGDPGGTYSYSGIKLAPEVWTETILDIKQRIEALSQHHFNSVLLNYYRDHDDSMGYHSDDEPELGARPTIASLSIGEERRFQLKHRHRKDKPIISIPLPNGSLLIMRGQTQINWKHGIPKERRPCGPRVNLTFRLIVTRPTHGKPMQLTSASGLR